MKRTTGFALLTTLLMMFMMSSLGIMTMQIIGIQQKMSSTFEDKNLSFSAAEMGLKDAEKWLLAQISPPATFSTCSSYPCLNAADLHADLSTKPASWWQSFSTIASVSPAQVNAPPRYLIVFLQYIPDSPSLGDNESRAGTYYYRITSRGTGRIDTTVSLLQTTVARRY